MHFDQFAADGQAQAGAAGPARGGGVHLGEFLEDVFQVVGRDADARVAHADGDQVAAAVGAQAHLPFFREFDGVVDEVDHHLADAGVVGEDFQRGVGIFLDEERQVLFAGERGGDAGDFFEQFVDVEAFGVQVHAPGFDLGHIQHVVDQVQQVLPVFLDQAQVVVHVFGQRAVESFEHHIRKAEDGIERRAEFVRHVGEEGGFEAIQFAQLGEGRGLFHVESRVLQGDGHLRGERGVDAGILRSEAVDLLRLRIEYAQQLVAHDHGDGYFGTRGGEQGMAQVRRVVFHIVRDDNLPIACRARDDGFFCVHWDGMTFFHHPAPNFVRTRRQEQGLPGFVCQINVCIVEIEAFLREVHHRLQKFIGVKHGGGSGAKPCHGLQFGGAFLQFLREAERFEMHAHTLRNGGGEFGLLG